jgi:hypothetical protein
MLAQQEFVTVPIISETDWAQNLVSNCIRRKTDHGVLETQNDTVASLLHLCVRLHEGRYKIEVQRVRFLAFCKQLAIELAAR